MRGSIERANSRKDRASKNTIQSGCFSQHEVRCCSCLPTRLLKTWPAVHRPRRSVPMTTSENTAEGCGSGARRHRSVRARTLAARGAPFLRTVWSRGCWHWLRWSDSRRRAARGPDARHSTFVSGIFSRDVRARAVNPLGEAHL